MSLVEKSGKISIRHLIQNFTGHPYETVDFRMMSLRRYSLPVQISKKSSERLLMKWIKTMMDL